MQQTDNADPFDDGKERRLQALIQNCLAGCLPRNGNGRLWSPYVQQFYYYGTENSFSYQDIQSHKRHMENLKGFVSSFNFKL